MIDGVVNLSLGHCKVPNRFRTIIYVMGAVTVGFLLRTANLHNQGVLLYDEGAFLVRAENFCRQLAGAGPAAPYSYVDIKIAWVAALTVLRLLSDSLYFTQLAVVFLSLLTIWQAYRFAFRLYASETIAFFTSLWMVVSFIHIMYSRIITPEQIVLFLGLLSFNGYLDTIARRGRAPWLPGVSSALAWAANLFRALTFPVFILLLEIFKGRGDSWQVRVVRLVVYGAGLAAAFVLWNMLFYGGFKLFGIHLDGFWKGLFHNLQYNSVVRRGEWLTGFSFFYILWIMEGWAAFAVFGYALLSKDCRRKAAFPLAAVTAHSLVFAFTALQVPRSFLILTPFFGIVYGIVFEDILRQCRGGRLKAAVGGALVFTLLFAHVWGARRVLQFNSALPLAVAVVKAEAPQAGILSTNSFNIQHYAGPGKFKEVNITYTLADLRRARDSGYRHLIMDQVKHVACSFDGDYNNTVLMPLFYLIETYCPAVRVGGHFNRDLMTWAALEGNQKLSRTVYFINSLKEDSGDIFIYPLEPCLEILK